MTIFDDAWGVVKMPLVPNSLEVLHDSAEAEFLDPVTNITYPMRMEIENYEDGNKSLRGYIGNRGNPRASTLLHRLIRETGPHLPDEPYWQVQDSEVPDPDLHRRGYMTAMYNAISQYLHRRLKERFTHDSVLSDGGWSLWNPIYEQQAESLPPHHPNYGEKSAREWSQELGTPYWPIYFDEEIQ